MISICERRVINAVVFTHSSLSLCRRVKVWADSTDTWFVLRSLWRTEDTDRNVTVTTTERAAVHLRHKQSLILPLWNCPCGNIHDKTLPFVSEMTPTWTGTRRHVKNNKTNTKVELHLYTFSYSMTCAVGLCVYVVCVCVLVYEHLLELPRKSVQWQSRYSVPLSVSPRYSLS